MSKEDEESGTYSEPELEKFSNTANVTAGNEKERLKIIYVDDTTSSLITLKRRLERRHEVYPAESSKIMFKTLEKIIPDIILLDINMPDADGYETIEYLKADERYAHIPVIFFTSNSDRESVIKGLTLGAVDYIIKPFETSSLFECIEKHVTASRTVKIKEEDGRPRILAVDDVVSILKIIKTALHPNYIVHTISRPEAVLDFLKLKKPDLILLDYLMPIYNGFELIPMIREMPGYEETPIIMLTSEGTVTNIKEAIALGACDFIVKPFKDNELNDKVIKHIKTAKVKEE
ncbi:MAG: response regulator [Treponema sp.]|nr:response regulator [Treponema sp.]MCL2252531.1 response regulator [Treponema sp.]